MTLSSADIKRQIIQMAGSSDIKKRMENPPGIPEGELLDVGNEFKKLTAGKGWLYLEAYMLRRMNLVGMALSDKDNPDQRGMARGYIELLQYVELSIRKAEEIEEKERTKYAKAKNVQEDETDNRE